MCTLRWWVSPLCLAHLGCGALALWWGVGGKWKNKCFSHLSKWNKVFLVVQAKGSGFILGSSPPPSPLRLTHRHAPSGLHSTAAGEASARPPAPRCRPPGPSILASQSPLHSHTRELKNMGTLKLSPSRNPSWLPCGGLQATHYHACFPFQVSFSIPYLPAPPLHH